MLKLCYELLILFSFLHTLTLIFNYMLKHNISLLLVLLKKVSPFAY